MFYLYHIISIIISYILVYLYINTFQSNEYENNNITFFLPGEKKTNNRILKEVAHFLESENKVTTNTKTTHRKSFTDYLSLGTSTTTTTTTTTATKPVHEETSDTPR